MQENFQKIGQPWVGQGGTFVGLMRGENDKPDYYLVLADEKADDIQWGECINQAITKTWAKSRNPK